MEAIHHQHYKKPTHLLLVVKVEGAPELTKPFSSLLSGCVGEDARLR